jgi:hypothetical protein
LQNGGFIKFLAEIGQSGTGPILVGGLHR